MFLMGLVYKTFLNEKWAVAAYLLNTAVLLLIFNLMMTQVSILYPLSVSIVILFVYLLIKAVWFAGFIKRLSDINRREDNYGETPIEGVVFDTIDEIYKTHSKQFDEISDRLTNRNTLFSQFIHNMKSSAAIIELACERKSKEGFEDIFFENEKLIKNLEQALNVLRLDEFSNDYVPERVELSSLLTAVINDKKRDFIYAGVYPKQDVEEVYVYTDKKWCAYILEQIVSNAIKYSRRGGHVFFTTEVFPEKIILNIHDEGIGILPEDLPRVFDLFYTGVNGRQNKNATGIGLTMVRHIALRLSHEVSILSEQGYGTQVIITFLTKV